MPPLEFRLLTEEEVAAMAAEPEPEPPAKPPHPQRCGLCGLFRRKDAFYGWRCVNEIYSARYYSWEHQ